MKKFILLLSALALGTAVHAQDTFVAGWDFDNVGAGEFVTAKWGSQGNQTGNAAASFYWDGTGPSTDFASLNPPLGIFDAESQFGSSDAPVGNEFLVIDGGTGFDQFSDNFGGTISHLQFVSNNGGLNSQRAIMQFDGSSFSDLVIQFAAFSDGAGTVDFSYSTNGTDFFALQSGVSYGSSWELDTLDLGALDGASTAYIGFEFNSSGGEVFAFDNLQIVGTASAVPEPASTAALFGVMALGFVASRRNRRK